MRDLAYEINSYISDKLDNMPDIDKDELESELSDIENELRGLLDHHVEELPGKVEEIIEQVHALYNSV